MAGKLNRYQMVGFTHWKGLTKNNHLASIWQNAPLQASNVMIQLLAFNRGKSLESILSQYPTKVFETDDEYTWQVIGSSRRNIPLVEVRDENGTVVNSGVIGAGVKPFYLVFAEDWSTRAA